jgi:hypothetical protein
VIAVGSGSRRKRDRAGCIAEPDDDALRARSPSIEPPGAAPAWRARKLSFGNVIAGGRCPCVNQLRSPVHCWWDSVDAETRSR